MDYNNVVEVGRLAKNPEFVPAGQTGHPHISFLIAVNRVVPRNSGPKADYIPCTYWGEDAAAKLEQMGKGNEVGVVGRIYTDMIERNGKREFFWEVRVTELHLGRPALKNLGAPLEETAQARAVTQLHGEFK